MFLMSNLTNGRSPTDILADFERSAINAIQANFANVNVKGCFFHLCSNIWKHVQNIGLKVRYWEEPEFALQLQMLTALTFLPPKDVVRGFSAIRLEETLLMLRKSCCSTLRTLTNPLR